jgi:hypothetical protein
VTSTAPKKQNTINFFLSPKMPLLSPPLGDPLAVEDSDYVSERLVDTVQPDSSLRTLRMRLRKLIVIAVTL